MKEISTEELKKLVESKQKFVLLDCRNAESYQAEHIPGALNLRWAHVPDQASQVLPDKKALIVTYCSGITCDASIKCYKNLVDAGYINLSEYMGGLSEWKAHGLPTKKGNI